MYSRVLLFASKKRMIRPFSSQSTKTITKPLILNFNDEKAAFGHKKVSELVRGWIVLAICGIRPLVTRSDALLKVGKGFLGERLVNRIIRSTFFRHFCAGETADEIKPVISELRDMGVGSILDYAAENDIVPAQSAIQRGIQCRVYDYNSEIVCDENTKTFLHAIENVHKVSPLGGGFAAIKVTALGNPLLLERTSSAIMEIRNLFRQFDKEKSGWLSHDTFRLTYDNLFGKSPKTESLREELLVRLTEHSPDPSIIDYIDWTTYLKIDDLWSLCRQSKTKPSLAESALDSQEIELLASMEKRLSTLASRASELGVKLMIDAEHTYFQPAIDHLVLNLQRHYNKDFSVGATVFNTYQAYLKDCLARVKYDMERASRENFKFAAKLVRGAYMHVERKRAEELGIEDPIQPTLQDTHSSYDTILRLMLENISRTEIMIATHNQQSIELALGIMKENEIPPTHIGVHFGQLLGMADHLTFMLGKNGYQAHKYVPYGPVEEVMPYLIRRAQENSDIMSGAKNERKMMIKEVVRRFAKK